MDWLIENNWIIFTVVILVAVRVGWKLHEAWMLWIIAEHPERMKMVLAVSNAARSMTDEERGELIQKVRSIRESGSLEDLTEDLTKGGREMNLERVGDTLYAYAKDTGQFLAQGANLAAISEVLEKRFPNEKFFGTIAADNPAKELVNKI
jgi:hypothetical protein